MIPFTRKKLDKLKRLHSGLLAQCANLKSRQVMNFAERLGRCRIAQGKEPTFVSSPFPCLSPITIPGHPRLKKYTAKNILYQLEEDLFKIEELVERQGE
jgi:hypothetical protein